MRRKVKWGEAGVTLVELIFVIILVGILAVVGSMLLLQAMNASIAQDVRADFTSQGRLAIERMAREIRLIRSATGADITKATTDLDFCDINEARVEFRLLGTDLQRRDGTPCVAPVVWNNWTTLASNIEAATFAFTYYQTDGATPAAGVNEVWIVQIYMNVTRPAGGEAQAFRTRVHPGSF